MTSLSLVKVPRSASFAQQLVAHEPLLLKVARKLCGRPDDAHDLVQDTLERALRAGGSPNPNLKAWLLSILQHRFIDLWRKRAHTHASDELESLPAAEEREEPRWMGLDTERVKAAVEKLHPTYRQVFVMHALQGYAYAEVARMMGIPKATVGTRLFRARQRLRTLLERELQREGSPRDLDLAQRRARSASATASSASAA